ncbi:MAG TPA: hypothetical protein VMM36_14000, partial [Opitutaceae bacterium]|nr:hypothetical protein [Opitutaceae bacterium]
MKLGALPCLLALVTVLPAAAQVDATRRNEAFDPKPSEQDRVEKNQIEVGPSRTAAELQQEFVTVPATDARVGMPQFRPRENATIDMAARTVPVLETAPARISTAQQPPEKFEKTFATPVVARIQDGMTEAGRVKATTAKTRAKRNLFERINRFVFRRNHVEPEPDTAPAGGV